MPLTWVPKAVAEAIGAFTLVFATVLAVSNGATLTGVALAYGLAVGVMVAALGHVSGGHFNPAVTLAFLLGRRMEPAMAGIYWGAQLLGGMIAAALVAVTVSRTSVAVGTPVLASDINPFAGLVLEAVATFFVVLVTLGTVVDRRAPATVYPLAIGLTITIGVYAIGPLTGAALNPARAFGPALIGGEWGGVLPWLIGPVVGAVLAWTVHEYVLAPQPEVPAQQS